MKLTAQQKLALEYLNSKNGEFISPGAVGGYIWLKIGKGSGHSSTGSPVCKKLVQLGLAERNNKGHYKTFYKDL